MTLQKQREAKKELVRETLHRLGNISDSPTMDVLSAENGWRYRNTVQFVFGKGPDGTRAGFHAPATHDIVSIDDCLIQSEAAVRIFTTVRETVNMLGLNPYERKHGRGWLKHLLVRSNEAGEALAVFDTRLGSRRRRLGRRADPDRAARRAGRGARRGRAPRARARGGRRGRSRAARDRGR